MSQRETIGSSGAGWWGHDGLQRGRMAWHRLSVLSTAWLAILVFAGAWNPLRRENEHAADAAKALRKGKAGKAVELYRKAMRALGERPEINYDLGLALAAAGKDEDAEKAYLAASTRGDRKLRVKARYNLGNLYSRMAAKKATDATKALTAAFAMLKKLGEVPDKPTKEQCAQFGKAVQAYKTAAGLFGAAKGLDRKAFSEYKEVLLRRPDHFQAKWNLELALRGIQQAKSVESQAKRIAEEYGRKCQKKQNKKNQDKKNQNKKNQNKKNQNKKQPKDQGDKKQNKPEPKKNQDQQKQQQKQQKRQKQREQQERNRREQVERQLDRFERTQRKMQRRRMGGGTRRRVVKDW